MKRANQKSVSGFDMNMPQEREGSMPHQKSALDVKTLKNVC